MHPFREPSMSRQKTAMQSPLRVEVASEGDTALIRVRGELDLHGCPHLEQALIDADTGPAARIVLDLEELTFIDGSGLEVLVAASRRSSANGGRLRITTGKGEVPRILHLVALDQVLPLTPHEPEPKSPA